MRELSIPVKGAVIIGRIIALAMIWGTFIISFFHGTPSYTAVAIFIGIVILGFVCAFVPLSRIGLKGYVVSYALFLSLVGVLVLVI
jgi:hypothetical protein